MIKLCLFTMKRNDDNTQLFNNSSALCALMRVQYILEKHGRIVAEYHSDFFVPRKGDKVTIQQNQNLQPLEEGRVILGTVNEVMVVYHLEAVVITITPLSS